MDSDGLTKDDWMKIEQAVKIKRHDTEEWYELYDKLRNIEY